MTVKFIQHKEYQGNQLTINKIYTVLGIEDNYYRLLGNNNDPCLYKANQFDIIDSTEPNFWVTETDEYNKRYAYPLSWNEAGFFEDYHDDIENIVKQFWLEYNIYFVSKGTH